MKLSLLGICLLLASTVILSVVGIFLVAIGVHGANILMWTGDFLILPTIVLMQAGIPIKIPFLHSMTVTFIVVFLVLQTAYYYLLFHLVGYLVSRIRHILPSR